MCLSQFDLLRLAAGERLQPGARVLPPPQFRGAVPTAVDTLALEAAQCLVHPGCCVHANRVRPAAPGGLAHGRARPAGRPARAHGAVAGVRPVRPTATTAVAARPRPPRREV